MYKSEQGHGICGAKNIYTTKTKVGNWVEDRIGMELASTSRPAITTYQTVQAASHCHPSNWPEPPTLPVKVPSAQELKVKNKEGMPYSLLFEHGTREIPPEVNECETFASLINLMFSNIRRDSKRLE